MEAEAQAVLVIGAVLDRCDASPQSLASVCISFVLLEELKVLQEDDTISNHHHLQLLEVRLLGERSIVCQ